MDLEQTLEQSLSVLMAHGLISHEEALNRAIVPSEIRRPNVETPAPVAPPRTAGVPG